MPKGGRSLISHVMNAWWTAVKYVAPLAFGLNLFQYHAFSTGLWMALGLVGFIYTYREKETEK
jgi:hypothetical protein